VLIGSPLPSSPATPATPAPSRLETACCLGRTCLQWRADGELIDDDRALVLQRLGQVDPQLHGLTAA
jgi:hypothetical protein